MKQLLYLWVIWTSTLLCVRLDNKEQIVGPSQQDPQQYYNLIKLKMNVLQQQLQAKQELISIYEQQKVDNQEQQQQRRNEERQQQQQDYENQNGEDLFILKNDMMADVSGNDEYTVLDQQQNNKRQQLTQDQQEYIDQQTQQQKQDDQDHQFTNNNGQVFIPNKYFDQMDQSHNVQKLINLTNLSDQKEKYQAFQLKFKEIDVASPKQDDKLKDLKEQIITDIDQIEKNNTKEMNFMEKNISEITQLLRENKKQEVIFEKQLTFLNSSFEKEQSQFNQTQMQQFMDKEINQMENQLIQFNKNQTQNITGQLHQAENIAGQLQQIKLESKPQNQTQNSNITKEMVKEIDIDKIKQDLYDQIYEKVLLNINNNITQNIAQNNTIVKNQTETIKKKLKDSVVIRELNDTLQDNKQIIATQFIEKDDDPLDLKDIFKKKLEISDDSIKEKQKQHNKMFLKINKKLDYIYSENQIYNVIYLSCNQTVEDLQQQESLQDFSVFTCRNIDECFSSENEMSEVIGDQIYRQDSNLCRSALHSSTIQENSISPQFFRISNLEGQVSYSSSLRNGIESMIGGLQGRAYELHKVMRDELQISGCNSFRENYDESGFDSQWKTVYARKGGFWQHYAQRNQKAIKYINLAEQQERQMKTYEYDSMIVRRHHMCDQGVITFMVDLNTANQTEESAFGVVFNLQEELGGDYSYIGMEIEISRKTMIIYKKYRDTYYQIGDVRRGEMDLAGGTMVVIKSRNGQVEIIINRQPVIAFDEYLVKRGSFGFYTRQLNNLMIKNLHYVGEEVETA